MDHCLEGAGVPDPLGEVALVVVAFDLLSDLKVCVGGDDLEGGAAAAEDVLLGGDGAVVLGRVGAEELEVERRIGLVLITGRRGRL